MQVHLRVPHQLHRGRQLECPVDGKLISQSFNIHYLTLPPFPLLSYLGHILVDDSLLGLVPLAGHTANDENEKSEKKEENAHDSDQSGQRTLQRRDYLDDHSNIKVAESVNDLDSLLR